MADGLWVTAKAAQRRLKDPGGFGLSSGQGLTRRLWVNASVNQRQLPGEQQGSGAAYRISWLSVVGSVAGWHDPRSRALTGCRMLDRPFRCKEGAEGVHLRRVTRLPPVSCVASLGRRKSLPKREHFTRPVSWLEPERAGAHPRTKGARCFAGGHRE